MKILLLVQKEQRVILDRLYEAIGKHAGEMDIRWLTRDEMSNLERYFQQHIDVTQYERIVMMLRFKRIIRQVRFLRTVPNLVIPENDACQNYIAGSKYAGKFSWLYRNVPWIRVIVTGHHAEQKLKREGHDAVFVVKGYDPALLKNLKYERDIELAFVGSLQSGVYAGRKNILEALAKVEPLQLLRTKSGAEYEATLNRIRFFVSCDKGFDEYMQKNFEAMAAGCVLLAWRQGDGEEEALGLRDMENIVLYSSIDELRSKLNELRADLVRAEAIAAAGQKLAEEKFTIDRWGAGIVDAMRAPLRKPEDYPLSFWQKWLML